jgi:hypothetical protein
VRLPPRDRRLERIRQIRPHEQPPVPRPAEQPFHRPADREVDSERRHVERHDTGGLVGIQDHVGAHLVSAPHDRLDVLDLP